MTIRPIEQIIRPQPTVEGAGVHLIRSIGTRQLTNLDPFLLLDHFESSTPADYRAGFPFHPHRGIETVTILRTGEVRHGDSLGHTGAIHGGDIQWMTSGSGILHEEMPRPREGKMGGFQLWVNMPAKLKMSRPRYQELADASIPLVERPDGARVRVVAGRRDEGRGPVTEIYADPEYLDVELPAGATAELARCWSAGGLQRRTWTSIFLSSSSLICRRRWRSSTSTIKWRSSA